MRRTSAAISVQAIGIADSNATITKPTIAPDITIIATEVAGASGADHCQPIVSCDQIAIPKARNAASAKPSQASTDLMVWLEYLPGETNLGEPRHRTAADHVNGTNPGPRVLDDLSDQQLRELLAVACAPAGGVAAHEPLRTPGSCGQWITHTSPEPAARRRRPTSATRRWASRCVRSTNAPAAVSRYGRRRS